MFSCVAAFSHMTSFIAGASMTGPSYALTMVESKSSARPWTKLASVLAVAGAMTMTSGHLARSMCSTGEIAPADLPSPSNM